MINILIPMAGAGSRFLKAGYLSPKPLIEVHGVPMISVVINNLRPSTAHRFIFIAQREHVLTYNLTEKLNILSPGSILIPLDGITEGATCSVLVARKFIDNDEQLMIANSDQYVDIPSIDAYLNQMKKQKLDGLIMTMTADDPKWSFVKLNKIGRVEKVVEKKVISDEATVGIYNFRRGSDFVRAAEHMIKHNLRENGEFYVAPTYNTLINENLKIGIYNIGRDGAGMYGLGTPRDLDIFLALPISIQATKEVRACT